MKKAQFNNLIFHHIDYTFFYSSVFSMSYHSSYYTEVIYVFTTTVSVFKVETLFNLCMYICLCIL